MSDLTPEARAALDALRHEQPTAGDEARVAAALFAKLPVAPPPTGAAPPAAAAGGLVKGLVATAVIAGIGGAAWFVRPAPREVAPPSAPTPTLVTPPPAAPPPSPAPAEPPPVRTPTPRPRTVAPAPAPTVVEVAPSPPPEPTPSNDLAAELQLLTAAREAASRSDWKAVLQHVAAHEQRFPRGLLSPERATLKRQAWCGSGQPERLGPDEVCP